MPIQRNIKSPRYNSNGSIIMNNSQFNGNSKKLPTKAASGPIQHNFSINDSPRDAENDINEIRQLIREQTNLSISVRQRSNSNSSDDYNDMPFRRFTPIPPIPRSDDAYFRTESKLIKDELLIDDDDDNNSINNNQDDTITPPTPIDNNRYKTDSNSILFINNDFIETSKYNQKKETKYHFGSGVGVGTTTLNRVNNYNYSYRLPSLDRQQINHHSLQNTMDLDEDLPVNPVMSELDKTNGQQRMIYTSPGDRSIISPVKRPQAPSPLASSYRRKPNKNKSESDSDSDFV